MLEWLWWLELHYNIWYRTLTIVIWKNDLATVVGTISAGIVAAILPVFYKQLENQMSAAGIRRIQRIIHSIWFLVGAWIFVLIVTGFSYQFTSEMPRLLGRRNSEIYEVLEAADIVPDTIKYLNDIDESGDWIVIKQIPEPGAGIRKTGGKICLAVEKQEITSYESVKDPENYSICQVGSEGLLSFCIPQNLFSETNPTAIHGNPEELSEFIYMQGFEEGLFLWAGYTNYDANITIADTFSEYEQRFADDLYDATYIENTLPDTRIITGVAYRPMRVIVYFTMAVRNGMLQILYVAYPFDVVMSEDEYTRSSAKSPNMYSQYLDAQKEDYRKKSYLVSMVFWTCSFGSAECMKSYDSYHVNWELPFH